MSKFFSSLILFVFFIVICFAGYVSYRYIDEKNSLQFAPIVQETASSTSTINDSSTVISEDVKVNTDKWKKYKNPELGYSISYPDDLIVNFDDTVLILAFPKKTYFHWPLQDDVKMVVNATSTCDSKQTDKKIYINGKEYELESDVTDAGAGSVWREMIFRFKQNDNCYKLTINTRGTNGAGFYVDDPALIKKYDAEHKNDVEKVMEIIYGVVNSFNFEQIPEGQIE